MIDSLPGSSSGMLQLVIDVTLNATLLALLVWGIGRVGDKWLRPQWKLALWAVVICRFLVPVLPHSPWSVSAAIPHVTSIGEETALPPHKKLAMASQPTNSVQAFESIANPIQFETEVRSIFADRSATTWMSFRRWTVSKIAIVVWLLGMAGLLIRRGWSGFRLTRRIAMWPATRDPELERIWLDCSNEVGVHRARLCLAPGGCGPATAGLLRPVVVLPDNWSERLSVENVRHVLLHELMHVRKGDILVQLAGELATAVHWFNPIVWFASRQIRSEIELACDDRVLSLLASDERPRYGHTVLSIADGFRKTPIAAAVGFGESQSLDNRISRIANYRPNSKQHQLLGLVVVGMFITCGLTSANSPEQDPGKNTVSGAIKHGETPVTGVEVRLLRIDRSTSETTEVAQITANDQGEFRFENTPKIDGESSYLAIIATKSGRASLVSYTFETPGVLSLQMPPAVTIGGRTVDSDGMPIGNVDVWLSSPDFLNPFPGVTHATSAADGTFEINDAIAWKPAPPREVGNGVFEYEGYRYFSARKQGFTIARPTYDRSPKDVGEIVLQQEAIVEGRVVDNGDPVVGIRVSLQGRNGNWAESVTGENSFYRLSGLGRDQCNIWANPGKSKTCIAVDSLQTVVGKTVTAPDIELTSGGWLEGVIVDSRGKPILPNADSEGLQIGLHGPARPKSGAAVESVKVRADGTFRMCVPPGNNYPYIMSMQGPRTKLIDSETGRAYQDMTVAVDLGERKKVKFLRLTENEPDPHPELDGIVLPMPVAEEREIAMTIRRFGGWYELDDASRINQVNMVYHYDRDKKRHDNPQRSAAGVLKHIAKLKHLTKLLLCDKQATDATMHHVAKLEKLETFFIWDARAVSDEGVKHLAGLEQLRSIHISESRIRDGSLQTFSKLPKIERLSIQGNAFTDEGVGYLCKAPTLTKIIMGRGQSKFSDESFGNCSYCRT